jgi:hypothetical protein
MSIDLKVVECKNCPTLSLLTKIHFATLGIKEVGKRMI